MQKVLRVLATFFAPVFYWTGHALGRPDISAKAIHADYMNMRGYFARLQVQPKLDRDFYRYAQALRLTTYFPKIEELTFFSETARSRSQLLQEVVCLCLLDFKRDGFFVEVGVGDGEAFSNNLSLEENFGWKGILCEPSNRFHDKIRSRRAAILETSAVSDRSNETVVFEEDLANIELSGISGMRTPRGQQQLKTYNVTTSTLNDVLQKHNAPHGFDFLTIDTEGSELAVLKGFDLAKWSPKLVCLEHNHDATRLRKYRETMMQAGYENILTDMSSFDAWFVRKDILAALVAGGRFKP